MVHISGMQNVLLENKKLENVSECGLRSARLWQVSWFAELQGIEILPEVLLG